MNILQRSALYISLLLFALPANAAVTLAGVSLPEHYQLDRYALVLNGAGIRSKFFVKVYVGALYVEQTDTDPQRLLAATGARSMQMHILHKEIPAAKIAQGWQDGFRDNLSAAQFRQLENRLTRFNALFSDLRSGDTVYIDYSPESGTRLTLNNRELGAIEGADFFPALLRVWIGERPADDALKNGILGTQ